MLQQFSPTLWGYLHHLCEILYWENNLDKEFRELKQQNQNRYSGWTVGQRKLIFWSARSAHGQAHDVMTPVTGSDISLP